MKTPLRWDYRISSVFMKIPPKIIPPKIKGEKGSERGSERGSDREKDKDLNTTFSFSSSSPPGLFFENINILKEQIGSIASYSKVRYFSFFIVVVYYCTVLYCTVQYFHSNQIN